MRKNLNILVTGGTSYIGKHVIAQLIEKNYSVRTTVRDKSKVEEINCKLKTLDDYIDNFDLSVDFIKCDVEGGELFTFMGGKKTISREKPIVFTEILRKYCLKFNYDHNEIFRFFYDMGYEAFTAQEKKLLPIGLMDESTISTNFFFLHKEKHASEISSLKII